LFVTALCAASFGNDDFCAALNDGRFELRLQAFFYNAISLLRQALKTRLVK
jgi:hypothetical protein